VFDVKSEGILIENSRSAVKREFSKINSILLQKEIKYLFHFTHSSNLQSILDTGLHSRSHLKLNSILFRDTDKERFDGLMNGYSCSITTPNLNMLKTKEKLIGRDFIILEISANTLLTSSFAAFPGNAARSIFSNDAAVNINDYVGAKGLWNLFLNTEERNTYSRSKPEPTDLQSEVIFFESIFSDRIRRIHIPNYISENSKVILKEIETTHSNFEFCNNCPHGYFNHSYHILPTFQLNWKNT
jgi:hypothetical protein